MKRIILIAALAVSAICAVSCGNNGKKAEKAAADQAGADSLAIAVQTQKTMDRIAKLPDEPVFDIVTTDGIIKVKLYSKTPKHRENFAKLAFEGFYDNVLFHRVIKGFMIQAGDPLTKDEANADRFGTGGPDYTVEAEFVPEYRHKKGALAAARRGDAVNPFKESSGSQFYLVQSPEACAQLDGAYTVFGETVEGLDIIDKIASVQTGPRDRPVRNIKIITIKLDEEMNSGTQIANSDVE